MTIMALGWLFPAPTADAFEFRGFGDITYTKSDAADSDARHGSFALGQLDLYLSQSIGDRAELLAELVIESDFTGEFIVDLERLQIGYLAKDWLVLRAGRFHNLLGYWNMAFHHGSQLQTTIDRPILLAFEDEEGVLPVHLVGLWLGGYAPFGPVSVDYGVMVGNGSRLVEGTLDPNNISDNNGNKSVSFSLALHPTALPGLGAGLCGNFSRVEGFDAVGMEVADVNQQILCGEAHYVTEHIEVIGEYYALIDRDEMTGLGQFVNHAGYLQAAYTIAKKYVPYVRHERIGVDEADPYMAMLGTVDVTRTILGLRYNLLPASSIKAEGRLIHRPGVEHAHEFAIQWAFWF